MIDKYELMCNCIKNKTYYTMKSLALPQGVFLFILTKVESGGRCDLYQDFSNFNQILVINYSLVNMRFSNCCQNKCFYAVGEIL